VSIAPDSPRGFRLGFSARVLGLSEAADWSKLPEDGKPVGKSVPTTAATRESIVPRGIAVRSAAQIVGNILITVIFSLLGGFSLELIARIVDESRAARRSQEALPQLTREKIDKGIKNLVVAFDGRYTYDQIPKIFPLMWGLEGYKPWIQIGNIDQNNAFSVVVNGVRKTLKSKKCESVSNNEAKEEGRQRVVWFYGGSTTFGQGVPWWDTIASKFVEEADRNDVCVIAVNFGVPFHFSRQEAM